MKNKIIILICIIISLTAFIIGLLVGIEIKNNDNVSGTCHRFFTNIKKIWFRTYQIS